MRKIPIETLLFYLTLCVTLLPLVFCDYLVTSDGPCHFYNSHILVSWILEGNDEFFLPFLQLNQFLDPNWITNAIQIPLLKLFSVIWAEKLFFAFYLLVFSFGFRRVIMEVNPKAAFLSSIGVLFAWNVILMKGFTNNAWSIAIWFWVLAYWIKSLHSRSVKDYVMIAFFLFALYLSHPVGLVFSFLGVACVVIGYGLFFVREKGWKQTLLFYLTEAGKLLLCSAIPIYFFVSFFLRREWKQEAEAISFKSITTGLINLNALNTLSSAEKPLLLVLVAVLLMLGLWVVINRIRKPVWKANDGLLLLFIASIVVLFNPPGNITGGLAISVRLGIFPFLCLLFWVGTFDFPDTWKKPISMVALGIAAGLMFIRLPIHQKASDFAEEIVTAVDSIKDRSKLLVLNYDWQGKTPAGEAISDRMWLSLHIDCYLGAYKDLVISDNYEANYWYFPLVERWETNMYMQTDKDQINFDHRPPRADMNSYKRRTGQYIDYVLMLSYSEEFAAHPYTIEILDQLGSEYTKTFTSENQRAILYKRIVY